MPALENLLDTWKSENKYSHDALKKKDFLYFYIDQLPFDNTAPIGRLYFTQGKKDTVQLYNGELQLEAGPDSGSFTIVVNGTRIPVRDYSENSFTADVPPYGEVIFKRG